MCDYSLQNVRSRPAKVGDKLLTRDFGTGTRGFAAPEDKAVAVCVFPGTEIAFAEELVVPAWGFLRLVTTRRKYKTAIFRQINKDVPHYHHDALEFPDGRTVLLTSLPEGKHATVLQLPAQAKTRAQALARMRVPYLG
jgi:hypothetical protein